MGKSIYAKYLTVSLQTTLAIFITFCLLSLGCQNRGGSQANSTPSGTSAALLPSPEGNDLFSISTNYAKAVEDPDAHASGLSGVAFVGPPQPNNYGAVGLSYPLLVPQGRAGLEPKLALSYSSSGGDGWLGIGWSLGLGAITRSTDYGFLRYDHNDIFMHNGKRLVKVSGPENSQDGTYRPEILSEEFLRLELSDSANGGTWKVYDSSGMVMTYGGNSNSRIARPNDETKTYAWYFSKATDRNGNYREALYDTEQYQDKRILYLKELKYTGNENTSHDPLLFVRFITKERSDKYVSKAAGFRMTMDRILNKIEVGYDGDVLWNYELIYENSPTSGRPLLLTVRSDKHSTQPEFRYQQPAGRLYWQQVHNSFGQESPSNDFLAEALQTKFFEGDFNGDGISDMVFFNPKDGSWRAAEGRREGGYNFKSYGTGYQGHDNSDEIVFFKSGATGDYDGNGKADIAFYLPQRQEYIVAEHNGDVFSFRSYGRNAVASLDLTGSQWFPGDFDGNGLSDSLLFDEKTGDWTLMLNKGGHFDYLKIGYNFKNLFRDDYSPDQLQNSNSTSDNSPQGKARHKVHFFNGDYNGDGRSDVSFYDSRNGKWWVGENTPQPDQHPPFRLNWQVYKEFTAPEKALFSHERFSGDYNGDGITDFLLYDREKAEWVIGEVLDGTIRFRTYSRMHRQIDPNVTRWLAGDYNGDGRSDIGFYSGGKLWVGEATQTGFRYIIYSLLRYGGPDEDRVMATPAPEDEVIIKKANANILTPTKTYSATYEYNANPYPGKGERVFGGCFTQTDCDNTELLIYDQKEQSFSFKSSASGEAGNIVTGVLSGLDLNTVKLLNDGKVDRFSSTNKDELLYHTKNASDHQFFLLRHTTGTSGQSLSFEKTAFTSLSEGNGANEVTNFKLNESLYWIGNFDGVAGKKVLALDDHDSTAKFLLCSSSCTELSINKDSSASGLEFRHLLRIGSSGNNRNNKNRFSSFVLPAYGSDNAQVILIDRRQSAHKWYRLSVGSTQVEVTKHTISDNLYLPVNLSQSEYVKHSGGSTVIYANPENGLKYYKLHWDGTSLSYTRHVVPSSSYSHQDYDHNGSPIVSNGSEKKIYDISNNRLENLTANHQSKTITRPDLLTKVYPYQWLTSDYNGDGLTDIGIFHLAEDKWYFALSNGTVPDVMNYVRNGIGGKYKFEYTDSTKLDNTGDDDIPDLAGTYRVVTRIIQEDTISNRITTDYEYSNGYAFSDFINGRRETDYFGFGRFVIRNSYGERTVKEYHNTPYTEYLKNRVLGGAVKKEEIIGNDNITYKKTEYEYDLHEVVNDSGKNSHYVETKKVKEYRKGTLSQTTTNNITLSDYTIASRSQSVTDHYSDGSHNPTTIQTQSTYETDTTSNQRRLTQEVSFKDSSYQTTSSYTYDSKGNLTQQVLSYTGTGLSAVSNRIIRSEYDDYGNKVKEINASASPNREIRFAYDGDLHQFVASETQITGGANLTTSYEYDYGKAFGNVTKTTDPNGNSRYSEYDSLSRPVKIKSDDPDGIGTVTLAEYSYSIGLNTASRVVAPVSAKTTLKSGSSDPDYMVRVYLDGLGREHLRVKSASGDRFTRSGKLVYDGAGRLISKGQTDWAQASEIDTYRFDNTDKHLTRYEYDAVGRIAKTILPQAEGETEQTTITTTYNDPWETVTTHSGGRSKKTIMNARDQVLYVEDYGTGDDGTSVNAKIGFCYDVAGNRVKKSDLNTGSMSCPAASSTVPAKDTSGSNVTFWGYDAFGQMRAMSDPDMGVSSYTYNAFGDMTANTDANSRTTSYSYDRLGRVTSKQLPNSEGTVTYTYDTNSGSSNAKGRLAKLEDAAQTKVFSYDKLGRTKKETRNHKTVTHSQLNVDYETEYTYDLLGRLKSVKYPENPVSDTRAKACYEYGSASFVKKVRINVDATNLIFTNDCNRDIVSDITYNEFGQTAMYMLGNGVVTRYTYDIKGRLTRLKTDRTQDGSTTIYQDANYAFAIDNNITAIGNNTSHYQASYTYQYDGLDRLVNSTGSFQEHLNPDASNDTAEQAFRRAFAYAKNGNLTRKEIFDTQTNEVMDRWQYTYSNHATTQVQVNSVNHLRMTYDSVGNLTDKEDLTNNLHKQITYNSYNRITQVRDVNRSLVVGTYHYDDQGFRVHKKAYYEKGGVPKDIEIIYPSMFFGIEYVSEDNTADSINNIYLNGVRIAALYQNSALAYMVTDQVDSVNLILDDAGEVLTTTQHYPYGETFIHRGDTDFAPKYSSQELDKESGLYYFNARYYDGDIARFTSADTVIDGEYDTQGWNRFSYVKGNPILYKDPTGHSSQIIIRAVAAACGARPQACARVADAVSKTADKVSRAVARGVDKVAKSPTGQRVTKAVSDKIDKANKTIKNTEQKIKNAVTQGKEAVVQGAKKAGKKIKQLAKEAGEKLKHLGRTAQNEATKASGSQNKQDFVQNALGIKGPSPSGTVGEVLGSTTNEAINRINKKNKRK